MFIRVIRVREKEKIIIFLAHFEEKQYFCNQRRLNKEGNMGITVDSIWNKAQRLSGNERMILSRLLSESLNETETTRNKRVASEIDRFFGGWSDDPRTSKEIMSQIKAGRTENTFPTF